MTKINDKEFIENLHNNQKPIEIKINVPKYIFNLLNKLSELSGKSRERIINNYIISELEALKGNNDELCDLFLKKLIQEIDSCIRDFREDLKLEIYGI